MNEKAYLNQTRAYYEDMFHPKNPYPFHEMLLRQEIIPASKILFADYENIEFPWHGHTYEEFNDLNRRLQIVLNNLSLYTDSSSVLELIQNEEDVYNAYFKDPIRVFELTGGDKYKFRSDGRHRIYVAQQSTSLIPIWVVKRYDARGLTIEEYRRCCSLGGWRFFDDPIRGDGSIPDVISSKLINMS